MKKCFFGFLCLFSLKTEAFWEAIVSAVDRASNTASIASNMSELLDEVEGSNAASRSIDKQLKDLKQLEMKYRDIVGIKGDIEGAMGPVFDSRASAQDNVQRVTNRIRLLKRIIANASALAANPQAAQAQQQLSTNILLNETISELQNINTTNQRLLDETKNRGIKERIETYTSLKSMSDKMHQSISNIKKSDGILIGPILKKVFSTGMDMAWKLMGTMLLLRFLLQFLRGETNLTLQTMLTSLGMFLITSALVAKSLDLLSTYSWADMYDLKSYSDLAIDRVKMVGLITLDEKIWSIVSDIFRSVVFVIGYLFFSLLLTILCAVGAYIILFASVTGSSTIIVMYLVLFLVTASWPFIFDLVESAIKPIIYDPLSEGMLKTIASALVGILKLVGASAGGLAIFKSGLVSGTLSGITASAKNTVRMATPGIAAAGVATGVVQGFSTTKKFNNDPNKGSFINSNLGSYLYQAPQLNSKGELQNNPYISEARFHKIGIDDMKFSSSANTDNKFTPSYQVQSTQNSSQKRGAFSMGRNFGESLAVKMANRKADKELGLLAQGKITPAQMGRVAHEKLERNAQSYVMKDRSPRAGRRSREYQSAMWNRARKEVKNV